MAALSRSIVYNPYAWTHPFLYPFMERIPGSGAAERTYIMKFVQERIDDRNEQRAKTSNAAGKIGGKEETTIQDFLDKMIDAHEKDPTKVIPYFRLGIER